MFEIMQGCYWGCNGNQQKIETNNVRDILDIVYNITNNMEEAKFACQWASQAKWGNSYCSMNRYSIRCVCETDRSKEAWVPVKELVPGEVYGEKWRGKYIYIGRDIHKNFCWLFIGNEEQILKNTIHEVEVLLTSFKEDMFWKTKNNKKIIKNREPYLGQLHIDLNSLTPKSKAVLRSEGVVGI